MERSGGFVGIWESEMGTAEGMLWIVSKVGYGKDEIWKDGVTKKDMCGDVDRVQYRWTVRGLLQVHASNLVLLNNNIILRGS